MKRIRRDTFLVVMIVMVWGLFFAIGPYYADQHFGKIEPRFPERHVNYTLGQLRALASTRHLASFYAAPLLFPVDLIVMIALSGSMGLASFYWLRDIGTMRPWMALVLPATYLLSDFVEDSVLVWLLGDSTRISAGIVTALKVVTMIKLASIVATVGQTMLLFALCLIRHVRARRAV